ncbi:MAG: hypothetical protein AB4040_10570 [Synechococcus sp.]
MNSTEVNDPLGESSASHREVVRPIYSAGYPVSIAADGLHIAVSDCAIAATSRLLST